MSRATPDFKKLVPALYQLARQDRLGVPVIGVARSAWADDQLVGRAREAVKAAVDEVDGEASATAAGGLCMFTP